jgi:putative membrane protein
MRIPLAVLHLLALGIGLGAVFVRGRSANRLRHSADSLRATFAADNLWGLAAILWISTGLWRAFGSYEKSNAYYWSNHIFLAKMGFLLTIIGLEIWPAVTLVRWRRTAAKGPIDPTELASRGRLIARISDVQLLLLIAMVIAAAMMARGYGARP